MVTRVLMTMEFWHGPCVRKIRQNAVNVGLCTLFLMKRFVLDAFDVLSLPAFCVSQHEKHSDFRMRIVQLAPFFKIYFFLFLASANRLRSATAAVEY